MPARRGGYHLERPLGLTIDAHASIAKDAVWTEALMDRWITELARLQTDPSITPRAFTTTGATGGTMQGSVQQGLMASSRDVIGESESDPLYPPTIVPPRAPLGLLRFAVAFVRNPLTVLPEAVYEQPVYRYGKMLTWVTDPPLIKQILLDEYENFPKTPVERRVLAPLLGNGMLVSGGPEWKWQRQTTAPVFRQVEALRYTPAMNTAAEDTVAEWRKAQPGTVQPIDANMSDASYAVISDTMLAGADGQAFDRADLGNVRYSWPFAYALLGLPTWLCTPTADARNAAKSACARRCCGSCSRGAPIPARATTCSCICCAERSREQPADVGYAARRRAADAARRRARDDGQGARLDALPHRTVARMGGPHAGGGAQCCRRRPDPGRARR